LLSGGQPSEVRCVADLGRVGSGDLVVGLASCGDALEVAVLGSVPVALEGDDLGVVDQPGFIGPPVCHPQAGAP
jgi:hypothetical protein